MDPYRYVAFLLTLNFVADVLATVMHHHSPAGAMCLGKPKRLTGWPIAYMMIKTKRDSVNDHVCRYNIPTPGEGEEL